MVFSIELTVRDYECDLQGIVNNAVYQNYYEHARHQYLLSKNMDFKSFVDLGIHLVMIRAEIDYKYSLTSNDIFLVSVEPYRISRLKYGFRQQIVLAGSNRLISKANFIAAALDDNRKLIVWTDFASLL